MKRRIRKIVNFFAFNLLFFALYLNFIHKDKFVNGQVIPAQTNTAAFNGTVPVSTPEKYLDTKNSADINVQQATGSKTEQGSRLSIN